MKFQMPKKIQLTAVTLLLVFIPIFSIAQELIVHVAYLKPTDAPDMPDNLAQLMLDVQDFYRSEMEKHGYGAKTFKLETDNNGKVIIHNIQAKRKIQHYTTTLDRIDQELPADLKKSREQHQNVIVVFVGGAKTVANGHRGLAVTRCLGEDCNHVVYIPTSQQGVLHPITAHEIGHTFGLQHISGQHYLMSSFVVAGNDKLDNYVLADFHARWLNVSPHFTKKINAPTPPKIAGIGRFVPIFIERRKYIEFTVRAEGNNPLHQLELYRKDNKVVLGWSEMKKRKDTVVIQIRRTNLLGVNSVKFQVIDNKGNVGQKSVDFELPEHPEPPEPPEPEKIETNEKNETKTSTPISLCPLEINAF